MSKSKSIAVGIIGATGYTGSELMRILVNHPNVEVKVITSRANEGEKIASLYPSLRGLTDLAFVAPDNDALYECDVVFFATPHTVAMNQVPSLIEKGVKVVDLSADFRVQDIELWEKWYKEKHIAPELVKQAAYGLAEVRRDEIANAQLVACPGCYPTSVQLGLAPLIENGLIKLNNIIANVGSGISGAGRNARVGNLFCETTDSVKPYAGSGHRHMPEIAQGLSYLANQKVDLCFVPHLLPMSRGILASIYVEQTKDMALEDVHQLYVERYQNEIFVDVMELGMHPETRSVRGSNQCRIALHQSPSTNHWIVFSAIDNLVKGASGQAVQCMNIMCGFDEQAGLNIVALAP